MPTTSNFGWTTPADTDLVKDGAAAIRTLGNGIDTSFVDLKGGTTGQVLAKASNTDLDFTWVAQDDSNAIQNAIVDAKGDLISATAADTPARLAVGTNGQVLTADSTTSTGLKWANAGTAFAGCGVSVATSSVPTGTFTAITFDTEMYDTDGFHSNVTNNSRLTIPSGKAGYYLVTSQVWFAGIGTAGNNRYNILYKNGSAVSDGNNNVQWREDTDKSFPNMVLTHILNLAVGDYLETFAFQDTGTSRNTSLARMEIVYLGA